MTIVLETQLYPFYYSPQHVRNLTDSLALSFYMSRVFLNSRRALSFVLPFDYHFAFGQASGGGYGLGETSTDAGFLSVRAKLELVLLPLDPLLSQACDKCLRTGCKPL